MSGNVRCLKVVLYPRPVRLRLRAVKDISTTFAYAGDTVCFVPTVWFQAVGIFTAFYRCNTKYAQPRHECGKSVMSLFDCKPGSRVIDLGCGSGVLTTMFAERGFSVLGGEPSDAMLERAA